MEAVSQTPVSNVSLKFINLLKNCSKRRAEEAKSRRAQFRQGPQAQRPLFSPKVGNYALQSKN